MALYRLRLEAEIKNFLGQPLYHWSKIHGLRAVSPKHACSKGLKVLRTRVPPECYAENLVQSESVEILERML